MVEKSILKQTSLVGKKKGTSMKKFGGQVLRKIAGK